MEKQTLDVMADKLSERMKGINDWIRSNPNTDPNFYEIMDCEVELGKLLSYKNQYYQENGYPEKKNDNGTNSLYTHHEIFKFDEHVKKAHDELKEMINLRGSGIAKVLQDIPELYNMWQEIGYRTGIAEYHDPKGDMSEIKKKILCKSVSIPFYIWQERRTNPDFQYDNTVEYDELKEMYDLYSAQVGKQTINEHKDGSFYEGPQFGEEIENLIGFIEKSYKYSTQYGNDGAKAR